MHSVSSPKHSPVDQNSLQSDISAQQKIAPQKSEKLEARGVSVETSKNSTPVASKNVKALETASTQTLASRIQSPSTTGALQSGLATSMSGLNDTSSMESTANPDAPYNADTTALEQTAKRLGAGTYGEVYLVKEDNKSFAFKIANSENGWKALEQEAQIYEKLAEIGPHDNVVKGMGIKEVQGVRGLALEHVEGCEAGKLFNTAEKLYTNNKLSHSQYWGTVQFIMRDVLSGVQHLAQAGISHSDIKGGNLLYDTENQSIKIFDFGCAAIIEQDPVTVGTPAYSAPEALLSLPQKQRASEAQDTPAVGQMTRRSGEHAENLFAAQNPGDAAALSYAMHSKLEGIERRGEALEYQALNQTDDPAIAGALGNFGKGGETAYVEFVNLSTLLDISVRGTAEELINSNFISDPLCQPDEARQVISGLMTKMEEDKKMEMAAPMNRS
ncbi:protein kinase [Pseudovibrio sp. Tun.PSC04-5.I4]|uniref:protein kinase domain-containing protein n=1 Tax=Pseudovibrio sp. Tun.PSC04-5.I4 TaxID=1798213 RepID=UPI00088919EB|nr:protein kinase [Pseudovibrio sp. Tun.PSC04-5.I4]SDR08944.1 Serine/threonine protein kinase [Pseudovibrio sp. Tun.PSC04-5.I4]